MNGLALFAGVGGLDLGVKLALPTLRTVCYVEGEAYAAAVLAARMQDGHLDEAPIWSDVRTFDGRAWRGVVDLVTAGFPCQPYSLAGKQQHEADERHLWPEVARIVSECEPAFVFLENVSVRAFVEPWRDLRRLGFSLSRPFACTAAELGAGHLRRRIFVLAYREGAVIRQVSPAWSIDTGDPNAGGSSSNVEHRPRDESRRRGWPSREGASELGSTSTDGFSSRLEIGSCEREDAREELKATQRSDAPTSRYSQSLGARQQHDKAHSEQHEWRARGIFGCSDWWASEPTLERMVHGIPHRVDRDRALGNAVVPQQAAFAFSSLMRSVSE